MTGPSGPTGSELRKSLRLTVPAPALFDLLVSEDAVAHWMGAEVEIDAVPGGEYLVRRAGWPEVAGEITRLSAPNRLDVRWSSPEWDGALTTTVEIQADGERASRLRLVETGFGDDDLLRRRDWLWSHWLVRLAAAGAQHGSPGSAQPR